MQVIIPLQLSLRIGCHGDKSPVETISCCTLHVKHITLHEELLEGVHVLEFDFHDEDCSSIPYHNKVAVGALVFKKLQDFLQRKGADDSIFDQLSVSKGLLNQPFGRTDLPISVRRVLWSHNWIRNFLNVN